MAIKKNISIKTAFYLVIALTILLPVAILSPFFYSKAYTLLLNNALEKENLLNREIKTSVEHEISHIINMIHNKTDPMAHTMPRSWDAELIKSLFGAIIRREDSISALVLLNKEGKVVMESKS